MKKLFDVSSTKKDTPIDKKPEITNDKKDVKQDQPVIQEKKKRGRPKKVVSNAVQEMKTTKNKEETKEKTGIKSDAKPDKGWKDFNKTKPELLVPCEFYVDTGNGKRDIFTGYIKEIGCTITDEPYKLVVLRKRYGNLFYREISGCKNISNCPNEFPSCSKCKLSKRKLIK